MLNDNLNVIDNNFKKVSKIGGTLQLKDDIDPTINATDDLGTEMEETSNAIDAANETDSKEIELEIKKEDNTIIITITNTYNVDANIKQIGKRGYTTKGIGHGYGLSVGALFKQ